MTGTPDYQPTRFVVCIPPCENTVMQSQDAGGEWRPKPALCPACQAENAMQAANWTSNARHPA